MKTWILSLLFLLSFILFVTNPNLESYVYQKDHSHKGSFGPLSTIMSKLMKKLFSKDEISFYDMKFFSIVVDHSYYSSSNNATIFSSYSEDSGCPYFIGIANYWIPVCLAVDLPDCKRQNYCNGKGLCVAKDTCLCLPSWSEADCSLPLRSFESILSHQSAAFLPEIFQCIGWLDAIMILFIFIYLLWVVFGSSSDGLNAHFTNSWWTTFMTPRPWTMFTSSFSHSNILHLISNCVGLYTYGPFCLNSLDAKSFIWFYLGSVAFTTPFSLFMRYWRGRSYMSYCGASAVIMSLKTLYCLVSSPNPGPSIVKLAFSQSIIEYAILGEKLDLFGYAAGILYSLGYYNFLHVNEW